MGRKGRGGGGVKYVALKGCMRGRRWDFGMAIWGHEKGGELGRGGGREGLLTAFFFLGVCWNAVLCLLFRTLLRPLPLL